MTYGENGSVIGPQNLPTTSAAPGVWSLGEIAEANRDGIWPAPFGGWIGQFTSGISGGTTAGFGVMCGLNSNNDLWVGYTQNNSGTSTVALAKITNAGALSSTHSFSLGSINNYMGRMTVPSGATDVYVSGYAQVGGGNPASYRIKLNDSMAVQWFGYNSSDQFGYRDSTNATYENTSMGIYVSKDGTKGIHAPYGYVTSYSSYNYFCDPFDPADGEEWAAGYSPLMNISGSGATSLGAYFRACQINGSNMAGIDRQYNAGTGGYNSLIFKSDNQISGGIGSPFVAYALVTAGSGYPGTPKMPPYGYNTAANVDRYPFVTQIVGGTYAGKSLFARWNHATLAGQFDQQTTFTVNAADSPVTPTELNVNAAAIKSDDATVYLLFRDNGNTPGQQYLMSFAPDASSSSVNWQNKILVYRTADGSSVNNYCYFQNLEIDSTDEFLYFAGNLTTNSIDRNEVLVFKLPTDGSGTGTWTVGDYTVVYEASNITVANDSGVLSTYSNPGTMFVGSNNEADTETPAIASVTGTLTQGSN